MTPGILATALAVAAKELRSAVRDRQTVLYTVVLPLALYPALFWILVQGRAVLSARDATTAVRVTLVAEDVPAARRERVAAALASDEAGTRGVVTVETAEPASGPEAPEARARRLLEEGAADGVLALDPEGAAFYVDGTRSRSRLALDRVRPRLEALAERVTAEEVTAAGADPEALHSFVVEPRNLASRRDLSAYLFSLVLPMTFALMAVLGAFYPAVDCTAGEKERRTSETTLLLPVPRVGVLFGKVLAVAACAGVATTLNLLGLVLAAEPLLRAIDAGAHLDVPWGALLVVLPVCGAFLFTVSALLVAVASFADTFKQGQSLLGTVQLLFLAPALVAVMPGVELSPGLALVPVVQTVLAFKAVLAGTDGAAALAPSLALVLVSQLVWAALAIALSVRLASREALAGGAVSPRRLLALWRSEATPR